MDCEKVRDQFSSLWEKELIPSEEKIVREHLASCPECQKEFEQFEKTMGWLRSVGDVEIPGGFLPELYKKMDGRKKAPLVEKSRGKWSIFTPSFKLPAQAVAMVAIVFLVLYLTKMMPMEVFRPREAEQTSSPVLVEKKSEQVSAQKEMGKEQKTMRTLPETTRSKDINLAQAPVPEEEKLKEAYAPRVKAEAKKTEAPSPKAEIMAYQGIDSKEEAKVKTPSPEPGRVGKGLAAKEKSLMASKPPQEIILRISDREKVIPQLHELVKQFGGEMVATEGNMFLASLPTDSLSEFEKELASLSGPTQADKVIAKKQITGSLRAAPGMKREGIDEKSKESARPATDTEGRITIRILLIQE
jgi:hypothetical protein